MENEECKIDSIAQSWSVISTVGEPEKIKLAMESLENHLVDREHGLIKLLDPPFEKSKLEPGYIKAYLPRSKRKWRTIYTCVLLLMPVFEKYWYS